MCLQMATSGPAFSRCPCLHTRRRLVLVCSSQSTTYGANSAAVIRIFNIDLDLRGECPGPGPAARATLLGEQACCVRGAKGPISHVHAHTPRVPSCPAPALRRYLLTSGSVPAVEAIVADFTGVPFTSARALSATYDHVGYYNKQTSSTFTFQGILTADAAGQTYAGTWRTRVRSAPSLHAHVGTPGGQSRRCAAQLSLRPSLLLSPHNLVQCFSTWTAVWEPSTERPWTSISKTLPR